MLRSRSSVVRVQGQRINPASSGNNASQMDIADPSLELTDPTPNVFELFSQFNQRFFWGRLSSVAVRWSKRMYRCAGICRYQGRVGFCEIALSEPLLKLRSRKELVETLLHEMIHAYLFVADNDRDRDGHGPKFQQHMYRINKEAHLNITIYHSFIDEVHLYQTHWWRCDGPCRLRKPFFGIVRRTCNRKPGPNDFWWNTHLSTCGGTFVKIKEPEKKQNKKSAEPPKNPKKSPVKNTIPITNYFKGSQKAPEKHPSKRPRFETSSGAKSKENSDTNNTKNASTSGGGVQETVRNHWRNKYNNNNSNTSEDRPLSDYEKIILDEYGHSVILDSNNFTASVKESEPILSECPVCSVLINQNYLEKHISDCIESSMKSTDEYFDTSGVEIVEPKIDVIDLTCISENSVTSEKECPICNKKINGSLPDHLEDCLDKTFEDDGDFNTSLPDDDNKAIDESEDDEGEGDGSGRRFPCPCCMEMIEESEMNPHLDNCLN